MKFKIRDLVIARDEYVRKHNICIGEIIKIDKEDKMIAIVILDSKEPEIIPDGEYGLDWNDGIRWYFEEELTLLEREYD